MQTGHPTWGLLAQTSLLSSRHYGRCEQLVNTALARPAWVSWLSGKVHVHRRTSCGAEGRCAGATKGGGAGAKGRGASTAECRRALRK